MMKFALLVLTLALVANAIMHVPLVHKPKSLQEFHAMKAIRDAKFANVDEVQRYHMY